eukprot:scaffold48979_cov29-Tisochrysis_lutea.AAC.1
MATRYYIVGQLPPIVPSAFTGLWLIGLAALLARLLQLHLRYRKGGEPPPSFPPSAARVPLEKLHLCLQRAFTAEESRRARIHSFGYTLLFACTTMSAAPALVAHLGFLVSNSLDAETARGSVDEWFVFFIFGARGCCILAPILLLRPTDRRALHVVLCTLFVTVLGVASEVRSPDPLGPWAHWGGFVLLGL